MSTILNALQKAQRERALGHVPGIATGESRPRRRGVLAILFALLALNAAVFGWFWQERRTLHDAVPPAVPATDAAQSSTSATPSGAAPAAAAAAAAAPGSGSDERGLAALTEPAERAASTAPYDDPLAERAGAAAGEASLSAAELNALPEWSAARTAQSDLPALTMDVHVFDPQSADRFVLINMRKYREGMRLESGPLIERITATGAVLRYDDERYLLRRD